MRVCSVTVDVDCLRSNFKGFGLQKNSYSFREFEIGIQNLLAFFSRFNIRATFFFVAQDLEIKTNADHVKYVIAEDHEVASHSYSHPQGFRLLSEKEKTYELRRSKEILEDVSGTSVIGFRAPGWNISDSSLPILKELGYRYDSSVFPTSITWILKTLHFYAMRKRDKSTRTTMGHLRYSFAPTFPYHTNDHKLGKRGDSDFVEFPIQVAGFFRLPFFATFHLLYPSFIQIGYKAIQNRSIINYQMHLSDFVDYTIKGFSCEVPQHAGSYLPLALKLTLVEKMKIWSKIFRIIRKDYDYLPLKEVLAKL
jgi:hypothetical protein